MPNEYVDNRVTQADIKSRERAIQRAPKNQKLGRWYAYRHYAQLDYEQGQGFHHRYLVGHVDERVKEHCTCGLIIDQSEEQLLAQPRVDLQLELVQLVRGHRNLPSCKGSTLALIVRQRWIEETDERKWTAYCQECSEVIHEVPLTLAQNFVKEHNANCLK
jgi:hypothetical protein